MFIVKKRSEVARFGLFLLLVGVLVWFVTSRAELFQTSQRRSSGPAVPTQAEPRDQAALLGLGETGDGENFFAQYRIEREQFRSARGEQLMTLIDHPSIDADSRKKATEELQSLQRYAALENQAERVIRAKGYTEVIVFLADGHARVYVKAPSLTDQKARQVADEVARVTGVNLGAVRVEAKLR